MNRIASAVVAATVLLAASIAPAAAEVVRLEITDKTPYGTFRPGEYVLWRGKVHGELSPTEAIPDLDKAKRNEAGKVEYSSDVMLLMPADPAKGNGSLLVDIPNRGRVYGIALYNGPRGEPFNSGNIQQGTGFLEDRGFSLAEVQWELGKGVELPSFTGADGKTRYVEGAGFAIVRDTADFLARGAVDAAGTPNPLRGAIDHVLASGKSQSGRFLKTFLLNGFNKVAGHRVIDGMHIFVSGAGLLPILISSPGPQSSGDAAPSFGDPEFRGVHEGPFTIGEIVAAVEKRGEVAAQDRHGEQHDRFPVAARLARPHRRRRHRGAGDPGQCAHVRRRRRLACRAAALVGVHPAARPSRLVAGVARDPGGARTAGSRPTWRRPTAS